MSKHKQHGFAHPFLMLIFVVAITVIGFAGWRVYSSKIPANPQPATAAQPTSTTVSTANQNTLSDTYHSDLTASLTLKTIKMTGKGSQGLAVDPKTGYVYVGAFGGLNNACMQGNNQGSSYLDVVDPAKGKQVAATQADFAPIWPAVDDARGQVYLASSSGAVGVYKLNSGVKTNVFRVGGVPHQPAFLGKILVASNTYDASQTYYTAVNIDTGQTIGNFKGPSKPHPVYVDADQKIAYMMGVESGEVQVIDMTTGKPKSTFTLDGGVGQMTVSKKYNYIITDANKDGNAVNFFDLTTHKKLGAAGFDELRTPGTGLTADDKDGLVFVIQSDHNAVGVVSLKTMKPLGYFKVGGCPYAVRVDDQRGLGFVTNTGDGSLTEFDLSALAKILK